MMRHIGIPHDYMQGIQAFIAHSPLAHPESVSSTLVSNVKAVVTAAGGLSPTTRSVHSTLGTE